MTRINQKEYWFLKGLDDKWKWIARDSGTALWVYEYEPRKHKYFWGVSSGVCEEIDSGLFKFIRQEDEEPYNISELISEYESEEKEMKSKQELIEKWESAIEAAGFYGKGKEERLISYMKGFVSDLNQLDEPETIEQTTHLLESVLRENKRLGKLLEEKHEEWLELMDEINNQETLSEYWIEQKSIDTKGVEEEWKNTPHDKDSLI